MNIIETHALSRVYGKRRAVDSLDMRVAAGEIYGFVGKNGAGKSTAMKMIAGLVRPTSGSVELFGAQRRAREGFSRVGALIEDPGILPTFSALENLMCKALALVGGPDLLLLDEPFNGLDPESTRAMRGALVRLNRERGVTMVISSHVLDQLNRMATSFGVIRAGRMVRELSMDDLHRECGSSIRVRTNDPARALAILEEALPGAVLRAEPDGSILASAPARNAATSFGGVAADPMAPSAEDVARPLTDHGQLILELSHLERDIEEYFVELMGGADA